MKTKTKKQARQEMLAKCKADLEYYKNKPFAISGRTHVCVYGNKSGQQCSIGREFPLKTAIYLERKYSGVPVQDMSASKICVEKLGKYTEKFLAQCQSNHDRASIEGGETHAEQYKYYREEMKDFMRDIRAGKYDSGTFFGAERK